MEEVRSYDVVMERDGTANSVEIAEADRIHGYLTWWRIGPWAGYGQELRLAARVRASNEEAAVAIANAVRLRMIAQGDWAEPPRLTG